MIGSDDADEVCGADGVAGVLDDGAPYALDGVYGAPLLLRAEMYKFDGADGPTCASGLSRLGGGGGGGSGSGDGGGKEEAILLPGRLRRPLRGSGRSRSDQDRDTPGGKTLSGSEEKRIDIEAKKSSAIAPNSRTGRGRVGAFDAAEEGEGYHPASRVFSDDTSQDDGAATFEEAQQLVAKRKGGGEIEEAGSSPDFGGAWDILEQDFDFLIEELGIDGTKPLVVDDEGSDEVGSAFEVLDDGAGDADVEDGQVEIS